MTEKPFVEWEERYSIGIPIIDEQHKELLRLTNDLYEACRKGDVAASSNFKSAFPSVVEYVKLHFTTEEQLMDRVNYPKLGGHKKEHESFIRKVLEGVKEFESGKNFVPNAFVRYLRDWVLTHIALSDNDYADYIFKLKKGGTLNG